jgi:hypothetical protein
MNCPEFIKKPILIENPISREEKQIDDKNKCFFINLCYKSNSFKCNEYSKNKFAFIQYNDHFKDHLLKLFPEDLNYDKSHLIGKIYSFEIEFKKKRNEDGFFGSKTTYISSILTFYFMFIDGMNHAYKRDFECLRDSILRDSIDKKYEISIINELNQEDCYRLSGDQIILKEINFISRTNAKQTFVPGFKVNAGSKTRKNKKGKTRKNKKRKSMKKKNHK